MTRFVEGDRVYVRGMGWATVVYASEEHEGVSVHTDSDRDLMIHRSSLVPEDEVPR
jgi:hypothetical protein